MAFIALKGPLPLHGFSRCLAHFKVKHGSTRAPTELLVERQTTFLTLTFGSHNYDYRDGYPANPNETKPMLVSGHSFSRDGFQWHFSATAPFGAVAADGTQFSTIERPHFIVNRHGTPTHLVAAVNPLWRADTPCAGCDARHGSSHSCVVCKTSRGQDWTYTAAQQLSASRK